MCESTILCHITGPQVNVRELNKCLAGRNWNIRELVGKGPDEPAFDGNISTGAGALSSVRMKIYSDDSAFVEYSRWNVLIIAAGCVRSWVENEYGNPRQFEDVSWNDDDVIHQGLKAMLIYCMGEQNAKDWFVSHGGSVATKKFCISDGERQNLIIALKESDINPWSQRPRMAAFLEALKPVNQ